MSATKLSSSAKVENLSGMRIGLSIDSSWNWCRSRSATNFLIPSFDTLCLVNTAYSIHGHNKPANSLLLDYSRHTLDKSCGLPADSCLLELASLGNFLLRAEKRHDSHEHWLQNSDQKVRRSHSLYCTAFVCCYVINKSLFKGSWCAEPCLTLSMLYVFSIPRKKKKTIWRICPSRLSRLLVWAIGYVLLLQTLSLLHWERMICVTDMNWD